MPISNNSKDKSDSFGLYSALEKVPAPLQLLGPDGRVLKTNSRAMALLGQDALNCVPGNCPPPERMVDPLRRCRTGALDDFTVLDSARAKDGSKVEFRRLANAVRDEDGKLSCLVCLLERADSFSSPVPKPSAFRDTLTGLPDRTLFMERLDNALRLAKRHGDYDFSVLFLDLDRFKLINDSLGHKAGDAFLKFAARRILSCLRDVDTLARLGADEFAVLLSDSGELRDVTRVVSRIHKAMGEPMAFDDREYFASVSIGVALKAGDRACSRDVLRDAEIAMHRSKERGEAGYALFDEGMHSRALELLDRETGLRRALKKGELELRYQPIVRLEDGVVDGVESLVRWRRPGRGLALPGEFIPLAESTGLIVDIDRLVLAEACRRLRRWRRKGVTVNVNLSAAFFTTPGAGKEFVRILSDSGADPRALKVEITESLVLDASVEVDQTVSAIRGMGVRLVMDDFGTGYSSLGNLHRFPFDTIKIDRSFIAAMLDSPQHMGTVRAIIGLGRNFGMDVVAEGVERAGQAQALRDMGCDRAQGWLYAKAQEPAQAERVLGRRLGPDNVSKKSRPQAVAGLDAAGTCP